MDETSKQLVKETRAPVPPEAGRPERYDYEYERNGVANVAQRRRERTRRIPRDRGQVL
jgi:hypothetical protein